ncbi:hypothetical protein PF002_g32625 [Phytophthora fragariae]|uniref:Uncharacterized protein n=1 Tax=Phytophthora fragariae TaxID=53985 RepID=A0A6A3V5E3_9STRA|nr:hypothetical protein PF003_g37748 [Phytophthora fragariae]KAE9160410.1 hypothetical protein PF002_g32625 [Phytophthora fragariae]
MDFSEDDAAVKPWMANDPMEQAVGRAAESSEYWGIPSGDVGLDEITL